MGQPFDFICVNIIFQRRRISCNAGVDYDQLHLHSVGKNILYVDRTIVPGINIVPHLRKPRKIWRKLNKYPVRLYTSDDPRHSCQRRKLRRVFFPRAEKLTKAHIQPTRFTIPIFHNCHYPLTRSQPVRRMKYP